MKSTHLLQVLIRIYKRISVLVMIGSYVSFLNAASYYLSQNGSDLNSGSVNNPWLSLSTSANKLNPGDTLFVREGVYIQRLITSRSGSAEMSIVITNYPNEKPVIDGDSTLAASWGSMVNISGKYLKLNGFEIRKGMGVGVSLGGSYNVMSNCDINNHYERGVAVTGNYNIVESCHVWFNATANCRLPGWPVSKYPNGGWGTGLSAMRSPTGAILRKNICHDNWGEGLSTFEAYSTVMEDNIVYNNWNINIYVSDVTNAIVQRNISYFTNPGQWRSAVGIGICDETGIPRSNGNKIINNLVFGCNSNISWWADGRISNIGMDNILVAHNTLVNCVGAKSNITMTGNPPNRNVRIMNNIVLQENSTAVIQPSGTGNTYSNNLWSKTPPSSVTSVTDMFGNPMILKSGLTGAGLLIADYFKIADSSAAINKGVPLMEVTTDFFGNDRGDISDIGAIEYKVINNVKTETENILNLRLVPNPISENSMLVFNLSSGGDVQLSVFDTAGQRVFNENRSLPAGINEWKLFSGVTYRKGIYLINLICEDELHTQKMLVL